MAPVKQSIRRALHKVRSPFRDLLRSGNRQDESSGTGDIQDVEADKTTCNASEQLDDAELYPIPPISEPYSSSNEIPVLAPIVPTVDLGIVSLEKRVRFGEDVKIEEVPFEIERDPFDLLFSQPSYEIGTKNQSKKQEAIFQAAEVSEEQTKKLRHDQYTVGWICALPKELAAARMMLDATHELLPNSDGDHNAYQLGAIGDHNVVIACLRSGVHGLTSATAAAVGMLATYPNANIVPVLVGVGGGVPGEQDVRLGDVVISTPTSEHPAVMQYDYGKTIGGDQPKILGNLNKPATVLLTTLAKYQSDLMLQSSKAFETMESRLDQFPMAKGKFARPLPETDILYAAECEHYRNDAACVRCPVQIVHRKPRKYERPIIHFGGIASGNQVIKSAKTRDRIATGKGILCFEMEAAGVMDFVPCLVIRGICDYCDVHKVKDWQEYAALAAAVVAREFLLLAPPSRLNHDGICNSTPKIERRQQMLDKLGFEYSRARLSDIRRAHSVTCTWLLKQPDIRTWLDPEKYEEHHSLLWIKGKPGTGKSTAMKFLLDHVMDSYPNSNGVIIATFFFSAAGRALSRSTIGMYRSLLQQIFMQAPTLQALLDSEKLFDISLYSANWSVTILEELLYKVIRALGSRRLLCFIDALDECPEDEIRTMLNLFQELAKIAGANSLYVCFSSRHYPHISLRKNLTFNLESQDGHSTDIRRYLDAELFLDQDDRAVELRNRIYSKSGHIFLWVVLVVQIIKKESDKGQSHRIEELLDEIPEDINKLIHGILTKDALHLPQLVLCIQWVLYAQRPLRVRELYFALMLSDKSINLTKAGDTKASRTEIEKYILNCSKGLVKITESPHSRVEFIHETVREFLLQPSALEGLWSGFEGISSGQSHEVLKSKCHTCVKQFSSRSNDWPLSKEELPDTNELFNYAVHHLLDHAEQAEQMGVSQSDFLDCFEHGEWLKLYDSSLAYQPLSATRRYQDIKPFGNGSRLSENFGFIVAATGQKKLFSLWLNKAKIGSEWQQVCNRLLFLLVELNDSSMLNSMIEAIRGAEVGFASEPKNAVLILRLLRSMRNLNTGLIKLRYEHDGVRNHQNLIADTLFWNTSQITESQQSSKEHAKDLSFYLAGRSSNSRLNLLQNFVADTLFWNTSQITESQQSSKEYTKDLSLSNAGRSSTSRLNLLQDSHSEKVINSHVMELMINALRYGAKKSPEQLTDLLGYAAYVGSVSMIKSFLDLGAAINGVDREGEAALHKATRGSKTFSRYSEFHHFRNPEDPWDYVASIELLLKEGANINLKDSKGRIPLYNVVCWVAEDIRRQFQIFKFDSQLKRLALDQTEFIAWFLLKKGSDVDIQDSQGTSPMYIALSSCGADASRLATLHLASKGRKQSSSSPKRFTTMPIQYRITLSMLQQSAIELKHWVTPERQLYEGEWMQIRRSIGEPWNVKNEPVLAHREENSFS